MKPEHTLERPLLAQSMWWHLGRRQTARAACCRVMPGCLSAMCMRPQQDPGSRQPLHRSLQVARCDGRAWQARRRLCSQGSSSALRPAAPILPHPDRSTGGGMSTKMCPREGHRMRGPAGSLPSRCPAMPGPKPAGNGRQAPCRLFSQHLHPRKLASALRRAESRERGSSELQGCPERERPQAPSRSASWPLQTYEDQGRQPPQEVPIADQRPCKHMHQRELALNLQHWCRRTPRCKLLPARTRRQCPAQGENSKRQALHRVHVHLGSQAARPYHLHKYRQCFPAVGRQSDWR
mmetsp:Transcript_57562/g.102030  ORF Transcript_57562/g.102030 Transcript_57562/m.102030 type:complete len:293 (+) Transcript_57562:536-1414(+)